MNKVLITGVAGFIGNAFSKKLLDNGFEVIGIDNMNSYYDVKLKYDRLEIINDCKNFTFYSIDIADKFALAKIFADHKFDFIVHLAAQAGVRYSISNPEDYTKSNLIGFFNILEEVKKQRSSIKHFLFASSSSVYGNLTKVPFKEIDVDNQPISYYAATKLANESMAYSYSHLYQIPTSGLRFFTVYGPWGRPDMALFNFTKRILKNESIDIYNNGNCLRDFTYIDDTVECIFKLLDKPNKYQVYNLGNSDPIKVTDFVKTLETLLGKTADKTYLESQAGDVDTTYADCTKLNSVINYKPTTQIELGIQKFIAWYKQYYDIRKS